MSRSRSRSPSGPRYLPDRLPPWAVGPQSPTPQNADEPRTLAPSAAASSTDRVLPPSEHQRIAAAIADMEAHRPLEWTDTAHQLHRPLSGSTRGHLLLDQRLRLSGATFHAQSTWNLAVTLERQVPEDGPSGASLDVRRLTVPPDANPTPRPALAAPLPVTAGTSKSSAASRPEAPETEPQTAAPSAATCSTDRGPPGVPSETTANADPSEDQQIAAAIADMEAHRPLYWPQRSTRGHFMLDHRLQLSGATFHARPTWNLEVALERQVPEAPFHVGAHLDVRRFPVPPVANPTPRPEMAAQQPLTAGTSEISAASLLDATETAPAEGAHHQFEDGLLPSGSSGDSPARDS